MKLTKAERSELEKLISAFDKAKEELSTFLTELHSEWDATISDKSDKWREGDAGQAAQERIDTVQSWLDGLDSAEVPDVSQIE